MKRIFFLVIIVVHVSCIYAQSKASGSCDKWDIIPYLYNDSISKQSEVCFWQNYWYERDTSVNFYFPDTLIVCMHLVPSTELWEMDTLNMKSGRVISNLYFKLGESADSYNIINSTNTERILLLNSPIDFNVAFNYINQNKEGFISIAIVKLPMKKMLSSMNVFTNVWGESILWENGKSLMLNQVIIETVVSDMDGYLCRRFEYSLPINGHYCKSR